MVATDDVGNHTITTGSLGESPLIGCAVHVSSVGIHGREEVAFSTIGNLAVQGVTRTGSSNLEVNVAGVVKRSTCAPVISTAQPLTGSDVVEVESTVCNSVSLPVLRIGA